MEMSDTDINNMLRVKIGDQLINKLTRSKDPIDRRRALCSILADDIPPYYYKH